MPDTDPAARAQWPDPGGPIPSRRFAHRGAIEALAFSADGSLLVSLGADQRVLLWQTERGAPLRELVLWDTTTWKELRRFPLERLLESVAFSPDGSELTRTAA